MVFVLKTFVMKEAVKALATTGLVDCTVDITEMMGAETYLYLEVGGVPVTSRVNGTIPLKPGEKVTVAIDPTKIHLFDKETDEAIIN